MLWAGVSDTPLDPIDLVWTRIAHDETVFGGPGDQQMGSVTVWEGGLVAVGSDRSGGDLDAAVWTSADGVTWTRIPHDETVFGGPGNQQMGSVTTWEGGLVAVGWDKSGGDEDGAAWMASD